MGPGASQAAKLRGGRDVGQVRGEVGRGCPCPWRGVCITHRWPLAGPGLRAQGESGRTVALRIQKAGLPQVCFLFFCLVMSPSMTQVLCWRLQTQACKQMQGPWVLAAWTL